MVHIILGNMQVCTGLYIPEIGAGLQLAGAGDMEWQDPLSKTYASRQSGGINIVDAGSLKIWIGIRDGVFGEDGCWWVGKEMVLLDWGSLVKDNL